MLNNAIPLSLVLMSTLPAWAYSNEDIPNTEDTATQQIVRMIEESVRADSKSNGSARRDAHAKAHGCVRATFRVLDQLPEEMRVGLFAQARAYNSWIRYSNGSGKSQDDSVGEARGMAVKLLGVEHSESGTQDFLMINHSVFFVRNAADYVEFQKAFSADSPAKFFFPGLNPIHFRLHEFIIANAIRGTKLTNPLNGQYWSTTPYLFGNTAIKYSARLCGNPSKFTETSSPDFLRENLRNHLARNEACFDFLVQVRKRPLEMPIEDPTVEWSEHDSPFIAVARITIPPQDFAFPEQLKFCQNMAFTPWHAIPEHRPLGGINRVRKAVYETVSRVRHELNGDERNEPTRF